MPQVSLSALVYDPDGCLDLTLENGSEGIEDGTRRVERVPTLDGGVSMAYGGRVHGDDTLILRVRVSQSKRETLQHLYDTYPEIRCVTRRGLFLAAFDGALKLTGNLATIRLLIIRKEQ